MNVLQPLGTSVKAAYFKAVFRDNFFVGVQYSAAKTLHFLGVCTKVFQTAGGIPLK